LRLHRDPKLRSTNTGDAESTVVHVAIVEVACHAKVADSSLVAPVENIPAWFQLAIQVRMYATRSRTER